MHLFRLNNGHQIRIYVKYIEWNKLYQIVCLTVVCIVHLHVKYDTLAENRNRMEEAANAVEDELKMKREINDGRMLSKSIEFYWFYHNLLFVVRINIILFCFVSCFFLF